jgi:hypothetical protein
MKSARVAMRAPHSKSRYSAGSVMKIRPRHAAQRERLGQDQEKENDQRNAEQCANGEPENFVARNVQPGQTMQTHHEIKAEARGDDNAQKRQRAARLRDLAERHKPSPDRADNDKGSVDGELKVIRARNLPGQTRKPLRKTHAAGV